MAADINTPTPSAAQLVGLAKTKHETERVKEEQITKRFELEVSAQKFIQTTTILCVSVLFVSTLTFVFLADKEDFSEFAEKITMGVFGVFGGLGLTRVRGLNKR